MGITIFKMLFGEVRCLDLQSGIMFYGSVAVKLNTCPDSLVV